MSQNDNRRSDGRRGTVLVISLSSAFVEIVGDMLVDSGFELATAMSAEPAWLSVTRTQPVLVICDANSPDEMVGRLTPETIVRRLPLLMLGMSDRQKSARAGIIPTAGITWLQFPLSRATFQAAIEELLTPRPAVSRYVELSGAGVTLDAGFVIRALDEATRPR
jgi:DNA-binding NtrC family response regulator